MAPKAELGTPEYTITLTPFSSRRQAMPGRDEQLQDNGRTSAAVVIRMP